MVDSSPPPDSDRLIERLAALGPVLDDLYEEAAADGDAPPPEPSDLGLRRAPRHRRSKPRRRALAAAAILLVVAAGIAVLATGRSQETITTDQTTTTTEFEPSAQLASLVRNRINGLASCPPTPTEDDWPTPWPEGWMIVGAPNCDYGWVDATDEAVRPVPVYREAEVGDPLAYWSPSTGWIPVEEYDDPTFDLGQYRAAYQAELAARDASGTSTTASESGGLGGN